MGGIFWRHSHDGKMVGVKAITLLTALAKAPIRTNNHSNRLGIVRL